MKRYYNKSVEPHWYCIEINKHSGEVYLWCQRYEGVGRYYYPTFNVLRNKFYFECMEDASMFALMWKR